jgi:hypothetical protein
MLEESFPPLRASNFVELKWDCPPIKTGLKALPSTSWLSGEDSFASVMMAWELLGLHFQINVNGPFTDAFYPEIERGDAVEIFIDTRGLKTASFNTKFCHHFFFLPQAINGIQAGEITHFRTDDAHDRCSPDDLKITSDILKKKYVLKIFIPSHCLYGYDPESFDNLGFTYRIHRWGNRPQHFSAVTEEYALENQPALWASVKLENPSVPAAPQKRR